MDILTANDRQGEYPASYYATVTPADPARSALRGEMAADICVVGGGYTGLSAALHLAERGFDVVLLEAHRVGFGASGRNGGQVGTGQRLDQEALENMVGEGRAHALWELGLDAVALVKDRIKQHGIACDWADGIIHADHKTRGVAESHGYAEKLKRDYGYDLVASLDAAEVTALTGATGYHGGTLDMGGGHVNPLAYALGLARAAEAAGVRICENSRVVAIGNGVRTREGVVRAQHVVLGANGYLGGLNQMVARRVMPINNFIAATEPLDNFPEILPQNQAVADSRFVINYWRKTADNRLLFGGGESYGYRFPRDIAAKVRKPLEQAYPQLRGIDFSHAWGGTLGITLNRMPHFHREGTTWMASGFSGHGVAMASMAGKMVAEAIAGTEEKFDLMAALPSPAFPGGIALRQPLLILAMLWYAMRDRL